MVKADNFVAFDTDMGRKRELIETVELEQSASGLPQPYRLLNINTLGRFLVGLLCSTMLCGLLETTLCLNVEVRTC